MTRMLVTRPEPDAVATAERLAALDIAAEAQPLLVRAPLPTSLPEAKGFAALAVTSANALRALEERGVIDRYRHLPVFAVGDRTAAEARRHGFAQVTSAGGTLSDLVMLIAHARLEGPVLHPAGQHQSGDLARSLAPFGVMTVSARIYEMVAAEALPEATLASLESGEIGAVLFYSRRTAQVFVALTEGRLSRGRRMQLGMLCLSEQVAEPLIENHFVRVALADTPTDEGMMALALSFARDQNAS